MKDPFTLLVYNSLPFVALVVAMVAVIQAFSAFGLRPDPVSKVFEYETEGASLHSTFAKFRDIGQNAPESGLAQLSRLPDPNRDEVLRILGAADARFWHRIRGLESWAASSRYLTIIFVFVALAYAASSLQQLVLGLSVELEHNTAAVFDMLQSILLVIIRSTWILLCLFLLNTALKGRIDRRKERWTALLNRLTRKL